MEPSHINEQAIGEDLTKPQQILNTSDHPN